MTLIFVLYLVLLIIIVAVSARKSHTNADFVIGGKKISGYSLALSERATGESAWLLLGLTGHAFAEGMASIWVALGCVTGVFIIWFTMAQPIRRYTEKYNAMTVPGLFMKRFPGNDRAISISTSLIVVFFFMLYIASQFAGAGKIFQNTFGIDPFWGMVLGAGLVTVYTMLGGFITVVATDAFQAVLMAVTCVGLPIVAYFIAVENGVDLAGSFSHLPEMYVNSGGSEIFSLVLILNGLSWAFGYTGQPQLLTRMMALRSEKETTQGRRVAVIWTSLAYTGAFAIGIFGYALAQKGLLGDVMQTLLNDSEKIMPTMVVVLLNPLLAGILLSGAVSAMMSTASSQLMVASTAIGEDVTNSFSIKRITQEKKLLFNKILILVVGLVAFAFAISLEETVYSLVSYAWSGIGASFGPAVILLLFWKRFSLAGLYGSLLGGTVSSIIWKTFLSESTGISERLSSYVIAFVLSVLFSLLWPQRK
ncbi:sodium/proline symporter [Carboxylicivirga caseinilyticus]|uniref:sodium/proline symporter n=1 Tax=Carboxylicivirga caseinilyticus TaxID=3417572 RepID=UPI003D348DF0|nr:sodium/proline symporter [Marinilabiliaceae bacterium A049]